MKKYLGIDIGGTKILLAVVSGNGRILKQFQIPTPRRKPEFLRAVKTAVAGILRENRIAGIGVGVPGVMDLRKNVLRRAPNLPFLDGWRVDKFFRQFRRPVRAENDCRCFLRAETLLGAGRGYRNLAGIAIGTGIGGGIILDGKMYYGAHNSAGEFGHMIIDSGADLETLAAKKALLKRGDRSAEIGIGIANIINALDPEIVIVGGGTVSKKNINFQKIDFSVVRRTAKKYILSPLAKKTPVVSGRLGPAAQAIGAALLFRAKYAQDEIHR